mgnify:FL=1
MRHAYQFLIVIASIYVILDFRVTFSSVKIKGTEAKIMSINEQKVIDFSHI